MTADYIRKFMDILGTGDSPAAKRFLTEYVNPEMQEWYVNSANTMVNRIKAGEYPVDVINEIAREYAWRNGGTWEAFSFARDALDRRAWEMGLRYTDETGNPKQEYHDGDLEPEVTELEDDLFVSDTLTEQRLDEILGMGLYQRIAPGQYGRMMAKSQTKKAARTLFKKFMSRFGANEENVNIKGAAKYLIMAGYHPDFVKSIIAKYKQQANDLGFTESVGLNEDESEVRQFLQLAAAQTLMSGGPENVNKKNYPEFVKGEKDLEDALADAPADKDKDQTGQPDQTGDDQDSGITVQGLKTVNTKDEINDLLQKASNTEALKQMSDDQRHDLALVLRALGIST